MRRRKFIGLMAATPVVVLVKPRELTAEEISRRYARRLAVSDEKLKRSIDKYFINLMNKAAQI